MLRKGSAGSNTAADHIEIVDASIAALPPAWRRNLMVTVDGAGFSHKLLEHLDTLAARRGYTLIYSCGWELDEREKAAHPAGPRGARGRSRSITAARSASAAPMAPATTPAAGTGRAGSRKRTSPS